MSSDLRKSSNRGGPGGDAGPGIKSGGSVRPPPCANSKSAASSSMYFRMTTLRALPMPRRDSAKRGRFFQCRCGFSAGTVRASGKQAALCRQMSAHLRIYDATHGRRARHVPRTLPAASPFAHARRAEPAPSAAAAGRRDALRRHLGGRHRVLSSRCRSSRNAPSSSHLPDGRRPRRADGLARLACALLG